MKEAVQKIIEEVNLRAIKDYKKMDIPQLSGELRDAMEFEREIFQKIEALENHRITSYNVCYTKLLRLIRL